MGFGGGKMGSYGADDKFDGSVGGAEVEECGDGAGPGGGEFRGGTVSIREGWGWVSHMFLHYGSSRVWGVLGGEGRGYSFAKTPLKAAQAPLAAASAIQEVLEIIGCTVLW